VWRVPVTGKGSTPLPWQWVKLDPVEACRRGCRCYKEKGGCGSACYLSLLSLLQETVGYPWTTMPDMLMVHAAAGFGGHGTLCGALAGASVIINMVTYGEKRDEYLQNNAIVDRLFWWYAEQDFPTERFDDLSPLPKQIKVKARSSTSRRRRSMNSLTASGSRRFGTRRRRYSTASSATGRTRRRSKHASGVSRGIWTA
jgi:hypothetical protein